MYLSCPLLIFGFLNDYDNMRTLLFCCLWAAHGLYAQFIATPPVLDGGIGAGEYGTHSNGANMQVNGSSTWFLTWDATTLYVAVDGGFNPGNDAVALYFDTDPATPVNGGSGSINGTTFDNVSPFLPFSADAFVYVKNGFNSVVTWNGSTWVAANNVLGSVFTDGNTTEFAIPFAQFNAGGRPAAFNFLGMVSFGSSGGGAFAEVPTANNISAGNTSTYYYYTVSSTADAAATPPFLQTSFTQHNTGSFSYTSSLPSVLWDVTLYDNQPNGNADNTTSDPGNGCFSAPCELLPNRVLVSDNFSIGHQLYIGQGSALLPATGRTPTITFTGADASLHCLGRLECVPQIASLASRRLDFAFTGTQTTLTSTTLDKSLFRFSNIYIGTGATLAAPASGSASIELEYGTLTNDGTLAFGDGGAGGYVDVGLRGSGGGAALSTDNDYYFRNGTLAVGAFQLHGLLIGQNTSRLQPVNTATHPVVTLYVSGNFENYSQFIGKSGTGQIDVILNGKSYQSLRGTVGENLGNKTTFYNLTIANDNGAGNDNSGADIGFLSYGGGTITYEVEGTLTLTKGDLRTRESGTVHPFVLKHGAVLVASGAQSDVGGATPSCFVDGPLSWEVATTSATALTFPVGKTSGTTGDYRPVNLSVTLDAATATLFTAELVVGAVPANANAAAVTPDPIIQAVQLLGRHYWTITKGAGANVLAATVGLNYASTDYDDGVADQTALRILKDDGAGTWVNLSPGMGGSASGNGTITSAAFTTFSTFALADLNRPLSLADIHLSAVRVGQDDWALAWQAAAQERFLGWHVELSPVNKAFFQDTLTVRGEVYTADLQDIHQEYLCRVAGETADGDRVYSNTVRLFGGVGQGWQLWQTGGGPAMLSGPWPLAPDARYTLYDAGGRRIGTEAIAVTPLSVPTAGLAPGIYVLMVTEAGMSYSFTMHVSR